MSKYKRIRSTSATNENRKSLETLIRRYLEKSEELEDKEKKIFKQVELMQSAVSSMQGWSQKKATRPTTEPVHGYVNLEEIERETREIREETKRIQREIRQKMEDNKKLMEKVNKQKLSEKGLLTESKVMRNFARIDDTKSDLIEIKTQDILDGAYDSENNSINEEYDGDDPKVKLFREKVKKLKELERQLKRDSEEDAKIGKDRKEKLLQKIEMLELDAAIDKQLVQSLRKKYGLTK